MVLELEFPLSLLALARQGVMELGIVTVMVMVSVLVLEMELGIVKQLGAGLLMQLELMLDLGFVILMGWVVRLVVYNLNFLDLNNLEAQSLQSYYQCQNYQFFGYFVPLEG